MFIFKTHEYIFILEHCSLAVLRRALNADVKGRIINALSKLKNNGVEEQTVKIVSYYLNHLAVNVDLENPEKVKTDFSPIRYLYGFSVF
jgi:hypothetical protein